MQERVSDVTMLCINLAICVCAPARVLDLTLINSNQNYLKFLLGVTH
jgi:hypothetical protein